MKSEEIIVANLKCDGCASTVKRELLKLEGLKSVEVDIDKDCVKVEYENIGRSEIIDKLHSIGYPETNEKKDN
jgi:copper chaperone